MSDTTGGHQPCYACGANCIGQGFWLGHIGPYCGRCYPARAPEDTEIATLKAALQKVLGHSNCYCDECKALQHLYYKPMKAMLDFK